MIALEARVKRGVDTLRSESAASWAFAVAVVGAVVVFYFVGRHQTFVRDDWASVLTRDKVHQVYGWQHWLLDPQDGHWLTIPVLVFHATVNWFGLHSYWPFLVPTLLSHLAAVLLVRVLCRRNGVSAWTTTLVCSLLLVFGAGWENMVFAIQISYNFSLVAFLAQIVLTDHDGPVDRRDWIAVGLSLIGVMSSGFGPIFMVGVFVFLAMRRRWKAVLVALVPQAVLYGWWFVFWETDPARDANPGNKSHLPAFVQHGLSATFEALTSIPGLGGIALVATLAVALTGRFGLRTRSTFIALAVTVVVMFTAIGNERVGFGMSIASSSRYLHVAAILTAPVFAMTVDQLARISREARWAGLAVVSASAILNVGVLHELSIDWAMAARAELDTYDLIAGSGLAGRAPDQSKSIFDDSPDVRVSSFPVLLAEGALHPRPPVTPEEMQRVRTALGLPNP